ncbi:MAG: redoxin domain-containing protein [Sphingomonadaceae bacterium]
MSAPQPAPAWHVSQWFNSEPLSLGSLRGKVVVVHAFQMLCPGCVQHGLPQAQRIARQFDPAQVAVIGLHTVFEHHTAMTPVALAAFLQEYGIRFPVGVDTPSEDEPLPQTMTAYGMRGTPTLILIDRDGLLRKHSFGVEPDMQVGADIAMLLGN